MAGATVVATATDTKLSFSTLTNAEGFYSFPALPIGPYQVEVQLARFQGIFEEGSVAECGHGSTSRCAARNRSILAGDIGV